MQKTAPKPVNHLPKSHPVYFLSNKHNKQVIPQGHPDREAMVGHINTLNQDGHAGEARRLYDLHITGASGAYAKGMDKSDDSWDDITYGDKELSDKEHKDLIDLGTKAKDIAYHKTHKETGAHKDDHRAVEAHGNTKWLKTFHNHQDNMCELPRSEVEKLHEDVPHNDKSHNVKPERHLKVVKSLKDLRDALRKINSLD